MAESQQLTTKETTECKSISSGQVAIADVQSIKFSVFPSATPPETQCFDVKHGDKKQYIMRVVARAISSDCNLIINGDEVDVVPYQSSNGELVFVTKTINGINQQRLSIKCGRVSSGWISSVGIFDEILTFGDKNKVITVKSGKNMNVLFTAMTQMQQIPLPEFDLFPEYDSLDNLQDTIDEIVGKDDPSTPWLIARRLFDKKQEYYTEMIDENQIIPQLQVDIELPQNEQLQIFDTDYVESMLGELLSTPIIEEEIIVFQEPDLAVSLEWNDANIAGSDFVANAIALDIDEEQIVFQIDQTVDNIKNTELSVTSDYVLHFENNAENHIQFKLRSDVIDVVEDDYMKDLLSFDQDEMEQVIPESNEVMLDDIDTFMTKMMQINNKNELKSVDIGSLESEEEVKMNDDELMIGSSCFVVGIILIALSLIALIAMMITKMFKVIKQEIVNEEASDEESYSRQYQIMAEYAQSADTHNCGVTL